MTGISFIFVVCLLMQVSFPTVAEGYEKRAKSRYSYIKDGRNTARKDFSYAKNDIKLDDSWYEYWETYRVSLLSEHRRGLSCSKINRGYPRCPFASKDFSCGQCKNKPAEFIGQSLGRKKDLWLHRLFELLSFLDNRSVVFMGDSSTRKSFQAFVCWLYHILGGEYVKLTKRNRTRRRNGRQLLEYHDGSHRTDLTINRLQS